MPDIIYKDECYRLAGIFYYVQNKLGKNCQEKQYQDAVELKLKAEKVAYEREKEIFFEMPEGKVEGNRVDFVIYGKIAVDLKTKKYINKEDYRQMLRYLKSGKYRLGLVVNFRGDKVDIKRIINSDLK
jgi:GxxExxY protein